MADLVPYLERLRELPCVRGARVETRATVHMNREVDAAVELRTAEGKAVFLVEHKRRHLSHDVAEHLLSLRRSLPNLLLFTPFVGRDLAARFGSEDLGFVDLAGNCHVRIGDRFLAHIEGRRGDAKPPGDRALRAQSYRVLFAILVKPELTAATARALAEAAGGVSPQTAIDARARFIDRGILLEGDSARSRVGTARVEGSAGPLPHGFQIDARAKPWRRAKRGSRGAPRHRRP